MAVSRTYFIPLKVHNQPIFLREHASGWGGNKDTQTAHIRDYSSCQITSTQHLPAPVPIENFSQLSFVWRSILIMALQKYHHD